MGELDKLADAFTRVMRPEGWLLPREVALLFGVDQRTVVRWMHAGKIVGGRNPGGKRIVFQVAEVRRLLNIPEERVNR